MDHQQIIYLLIGAIVVSKGIIGVLIVNLLKQKRELKSQRDRLRLSNAELESHVAKISEQNEEIVAAEKFKLKVLSLASHDLRTPFQELAMLLEYADVINLGEDEFKKHMRTIRTKVRTSKDMLDNVLVWTAGQLRDNGYVTSDFVLAEQVKRAVDLFGTHLEAKQLSIELNVPDTASVFGNAEILNFVVRNILSNAIKYSHPGGSIQIGCSYDRGAVHAIYVRDFGKGMEGSILNDLRDGQVRESSVGTRQEQGAGMGLSLCRDLLRRVGWSLIAESEYGEGSCFTLVFGQEADNVIAMDSGLQTGTI